MAAQDVRRKQLYLIRHAESEHNAKSKFPDRKEQDFVNTCLTSNGIDQAGKIQGPVNLLILSPMKRCVQTYAHSKLTVGRVVMSDLVREWRVYGPASFLEHEKQEAEPRAVFMARVEATSQLLKQQPENSIAILAHGVFLSELMLKLGDERGLRGMCNAQVIHLKDIKL